MKRREDLKEIRIEIPLSTSKEPEIADGKNGS
jgi:hypothetical protein